MATRRMKRSSPQRILRPSPYKFTRITVQDMFLDHAEELKHMPADLAYDRAKELAYDANELHPFPNHIIRLRKRLADSRRERRQANI